MPRLLPLAQAIYLSAWFWGWMAVGAVFGVRWMLAS